MSSWDRFVYLFSVYPACSSLHFSVKVWVWTLDFFSSLSFIALLDSEACACCSTVSVVTRGLNHRLSWAEFVYLWFSGGEMLCFLLCLTANGTVPLYGSFYSEKHRRGQKEGRRSEEMLCHMLTNISQRWRSNWNWMERWIQRGMSRWNWHVVQYWSKAAGVDERNDSCADAGTVMEESREDV